MSSGINEVMLAASSSPAASIIVKSTIATALALAGVRLAHKTSAAVRHTLLIAAFGVLLVLPVASLVAPPVRIALPIAAQQRAAAHPLAGPAAADSPIGRGGVGAADAMPPSSLSAFDLLLLTGWMAGLAVFLLPVAMGLWQVRSLRRSALPWPHGQAVAGSLALEAGVGRRVDVLLHEALPGPITCGTAHPAIVLPMDAQTWERDDLNRAIVHELEHVRRGDWASHCMARAVCAVYWFHPLVWIAWRWLALEAERSCDDAVLGRSDATAYADQLVGLARRQRMAAKSPLLAMASRADLSTRVRAVLDSGQRRGRAGAVPVGLACAGAAVLVLTMAPLTMVAAPQAANADSPQISRGRLSANTTLVIADVAVTDKDGKIVEGLGANDFVVTEDGVAQHIAICDFQKLTGTPSSYYILGYYAQDGNPDGKYRKIAVTLKNDRTAKLDYRTGYYSRSSGAGVAGNGNHAAVSSVPGETPPVLLLKREPEYSEEARKAKYQGTVVLNVEIDASGQVTAASSTRTLGLGLDQKAIEAVKKWRFKPATKDGRPVAVQTTVDVTFRLL